MPHSTCSLIIPCHHPDVRVIWAWISDDTGKEMFATSPVVAWRTYSACDSNDIKPMTAMNCSYPSFPKGTTKWVSEHAGYGRPYQIFMEESTTEPEKASWSCSEFNPSKECTWEHDILCAFQSMRRSREAGKRKRDE